MRSDISDTERALPRRHPDQAKCASPFCDNATRVSGEFCAGCRAQQERQREAIRQFRERQAN